MQTVERNISIHRCNRNASNKGIRGRVKQKGNRQLFSQLRASAAVTVKVVCTSESTATTHTATTTETKWVKNSTYHGDCIMILSELLKSMFRNSSLQNRHFRGTCANRSSNNSPITTIWYCELMRSKHSGFIVIDIEEKRNRTFLCNYYDAA